jgi:hypothetical protein
MLSLDKQEVEEIAELLTSLRRHYNSAEHPSLLLDAPVRARPLPPRVQEYLNRFRRQEPGYVIISGHPSTTRRSGPRRAIGTSFLARPQRWTKTSCLCCTQPFWVMRLVGPPNRTAEWCTTSCR